MAGSSNGPGQLSRRRYENDNSPYCEAVLLNLGSLRNHHTTSDSASSVESALRAQMWTAYQLHGHEASEAACRTLYWPSGGLDDGAGLGKGTLENPIPAFEPFRLIAMPTLVEPIVSSTQQIPARNCSPRRNTA